MNPIAVFMCPGRGRAGVMTTSWATGAVTDYGINWRLNDNGGSTGSSDKNVRIHSIPDGSSNVILLGQVALRTEHSIEVRDARQSMLMPATWMIAL